MAGKLSRRFAMGVVVLVVPINHFDVEIGEVGNLLPAVQHILELVRVVLRVPPEHVRSIPSAGKEV